MRTHIGFGSPDKQDTFASHGSPLGEGEVKLTKQNLGWPVKPPFLIPDEALQHFRKAVESGRQAESEWDAKFAAFQKQYPQLASELLQWIDGKLQADWIADIPFFPADAKLGVV